jgi:hypothetical protein
MKEKKNNDENDSSRNPPRYWEETAQSKHTAADNAKRKPAVTHSLSAISFFLIYFFWLVFLKKWKKNNQNLLSSLKLSLHFVFVFYKTD